jgi:DNA primase
MRLDAAVVKERVDIRDLMSRYCPGKVTATPTGAKARCPLHDDRNPSFSGLNDSKYLTCFAGCFAGDAIEFLQRMENLTFPEALERLAEWYAPEPLGISHPRPKPRNKPNGKEKMPPQPKRSSTRIPIATTRRIAL